MDKEEGALTDAIIRHNRQTAKAFRMIVDKYAKEFHSDEEGGQIISLDDVDHVLKNTLNINVYATDEDTDLESDYYNDDDYQSLQSLVHQKIVKVKKEINWDEEESKERERLEKQVFKTRSRDDSESDISSDEGEVFGQVKNRRRRRRTEDYIENDGNGSETLYETDYFSNKEDNESNTNSELKSGPDTSTDSLHDILQQRLVQVKKEINWDEEEKKEKERLASLVKTRQPRPRDESRESDDEEPDKRVFKTRQPRPSDESNESDDEEPDKRVFKTRQPRPKDESNEYGNAEEFHRQVIKTRRSRPRDESDELDDEEELLYQKKKRKRKRRTLYIQEKIYKLIPNDGSKKETVIDYPQPKNSFTYDSYHHDNQTASCHQLCECHQTHPILSHDLKSCDSVYVSTCNCVSNYREITPPSVNVSPMYHNYNPHCVQYGCHDEHKYQIIPFDKSYCL